MFCFVIGLFITIMFSGICFLFITLPYFYSFIFLHLPFVKLVIIETFIEIGIIINFILRHIYDDSQKSKFIGTSIIILLGLFSFLICFSNDFRTFIIINVPILFDGYSLFYDFVDNIVDKLTEFFIG